MPPLFEVKKKVEHGVTNPITARLTLQIIAILENTTLWKEKQEKINLLLVTSLLPKLLRCWEIEQKFRKSWEESVAKFKPPGHGAAAVEVPQIPRLREDCEDFLYSAKNYLRDLVIVFNDLHGTDYKDASDWTPVGRRTDSIMIYAKEKYGPNHVNARFFAQLPACAVPLVDMRNAVEHPNGHSGTLITTNIELKGARELVPPSWWREKDSAIPYGPLPIIGDMAVGVNNLLVLAESIVVMWARENIHPPGALDVVEIPDAKIDSNKPIKYKTMPTAALLKQITEATAKTPPAT